MPEVKTEEWDDFIAAHPDSHILQTSSWGELKASFGWNVVRIISGDCGSQVLFRRPAPGFTLAYIPRGPIGNQWELLWPELDRLCKSRNALMLKIEPDQWEAASSNNQAPEGFALSPQSIQPPRTIRIPIDGAEEEILGQMKQKTRYNISLARRKGVSVSRSDDIPTFHKMTEVTAGRGGFGVHSLEYYQKAYDLFHPAGLCELLTAEYDGEPLAGILIFMHGNRAWYFYGASTNKERNRMPAYLLQWEAILWARDKGCLEYDLWGVPDEDEETLEEEFTERHDDLWGVYRFKRGFGGKLSRASGPWDRVYQPSLYRIYSWMAKRRSA